MSAEDPVWTRINNALATVSEHQANAALRQEQADKQMAAVHNALAESAKQIAKTAAAQEVTEERLQKLIHKVDEVDDRVGKLEKKKP